MTSAPNYPHVADIAITLNVADEHKEIGVHVAKNRLPLPLQVVKAVGPHTLEEFAPIMEENTRSYHPPGRIMVGFWYPTPGFLRTLENSVERSAKDQDPNILIWAQKTLKTATALPWPRENSSDLSAADTAALVEYLDLPHKRIGFCGISTCRLCPDFTSVGSEDVDDGTYVFPSGLAHYVSKHQVGLPAQFVAHCLGGGKPPVMTTLTGWTHADRERGFEREIDLPGVIKPSPEEVKAHIRYAFRKCDFPMFQAFDAVEIEAQLRNGRVVSIRELGRRVPVVERGDRLYLPTTE